MDKPVFRKLIASKSKFEDEIGYSRAVISGEWIFVSGTTGYNYESHSLADSVEDQCAQALSNIETSLKGAGATWNDVVRVTYILPERSDFDKCHPILRSTFGDVRPAATYIQAGLSEENMKVEIEVTAHASRWYNTTAFAFVMFGIFQTGVDLGTLLSVLAAYLTNRR